MRALLTLIATITALALAAPAQADVISASGGSGSNGHKLLWTLAFDDVADTITIDATHTQFDGSAALGAPRVAQINLVLPNGQQVGVNLLTARIVGGGGQMNGSLFDGINESMVNAGPRTRTNVRLRVSSNRARLIEFNTDYTPPA